MATEYNISLPSISGTSFNSYNAPNIDRTSSTVSTVYVIVAFSKLIWCSAENFRNSSGLTFMRHGSIFAQTQASRQALIMRLPMSKNRRTAIYTALTLFLRNCCDVSSGWTGGREGGGGGRRRREALLCMYDFVRNTVLVLWPIESLDKYLVLTRNCHRRCVCFAKILRNKLIEGAAPEGLDHKHEWVPQLPQNLRIEFMLSNQLGAVRLREVNVRIPRARSFGQPNDAQFA